GQSGASQATPPGAPSLSEKKISRASRLTLHALRITMSTTEIIWVAIGFLGQGLFFGRWLIQWIASERKAESRVPVAFWYMSLVVGLITLANASYRREPVFIAGQSIGALVYIRNLMLIYRQGPRSAAESVQPAAHRQERPAP